MDHVPHMTDAMRSVWLSDSRQAQASETDRLLASAKLRAADGHFAEARAALKQAMSQLDLPNIPRGEWLPLCLAALYCRDLGAISTILTEAGGGGLTVDVCLREDPPAARDQNTFLSTIHDRSKLTFIMPVSAYVSPHLPFLLSRMISTLPLFVKQVHLGSRADATIGLNIGDFGRVPGLAFCTNAPGFALIPDSEFLQSRGYESVRNQFLNHPVQWHARRQVAFWRGATTGQPAAPGLGWRSLPRATLCQIARDDRPDLFDIGISRIELPPNHVGWTEMPASGLMRPPVPMSRFQDFRYHVDIDGHTSAWGGLFQKLLTGSPVLKVQSAGGWRQWYYDRLEPWTNFIPIKPDMSDLAAIVAWLRRHDAAAKRIGQAGQALAVSLSYDSQVEAGARTIQAVDTSDAPV